MNKKSGILMHITSLPGKEAVGTLLDGIHFLDDLKKARQSIWQILPFHPTGVDGSPFSGSSVFAGNPILINLQALTKHDLDQISYNEFLQKWSVWKRTKKKTDKQVDYGFLWKHKLGYAENNSVLKQAYKGFLANPSRHLAFEDFCLKEAYWLDNYAEFMTIKSSQGFEKTWIQWPENFCWRKKKYQVELDDEQLDFFKYLQFVFHEQFSLLSEHAQQLNIELIGDIPMYPGYDSADVWAHKNLFQLDKNGNMTQVSGVPPDYFSKNGQRWGTPLYKWGSKGSSKEQSDVYYWWAKRFTRLLTYVNTIRIDHFRGFTAYGSIPEPDKTARNAKWVKGPGTELFSYLKTALSQKLPVIAEDLGVITQAVRDDIAELGYPGMKILLFANFANQEDNYLPENAPANSVFYTGTHDNKTFMQFYLLLNKTQRRKIERYLSKSNESFPYWKAIDLLFSSKASRVIIPLQDILGLGKEARMNRPGTSKGNWSWRVNNKEYMHFHDELAHLAQLSKKHNRTFSIR